MPSEPREGTVKTRYYTALLTAVERSIHSNWHYRLPVVIYFLMTFAKHIMTSVKESGIRCLPLIHVFPITPQVVR